MNSCLPARAATWVAEVVPEDAHYSFATRHSGIIINGAPTFAMENRRSVFLGRGWKARASSQAISSSNQRCNQRLSNLLGAQRRLHSLADDHGTLQRGEEDQRLFLV